MRERLRYLHYSLNTEQTYVYWVRWFVRFHGVRHPKEMGAPEVEAFLTTKDPGQVDIPPVQQIKKSIREAEAVSGIQTFGMRREQACFLDDGTLAGEMMTNAGPAKWTGERLKKRKG